MLDNSNDPGVQGPGASGLNIAAFSPRSSVLTLRSRPARSQAMTSIKTTSTRSCSSKVTPVAFRPWANLAGADGPDLDVNDDGVLEVQPWTSVIDGVSATEVGDPGFQYASQFGGVDFAGGFGADVWARLREPAPNGDWAFFDSSSGDGIPAGFQGPFFANDGGDAAFLDGTEIVVNNNSTFLLATPGAPNAFGTIPEPATGFLMAVTMALLAARRRVH